MRRLGAALALLLGWWPVAARAEAPAAAAGTVDEVVVRGTRWIEEAAVLARIGLRSGDTITSEKVRTDLEAVYASGYFEDVEVRTEETASGRTKLIFVVVEKPAVLDVKIEGEKKVKEEDLRELIDVRSFGVLNQTKIQETVAALRDKYVEEGFYLVEIDPEVVEIGKDRVEVVFHIVENRKVRVQRVAFTGNVEVPDRKIRRFLQTKEAGPIPWLTQSGKFNRDVLDNDQQLVQLVFLEEGYVDARVDRPKVYLSPDKRFLYVSFHVDEGQRYKIGGLEVDGDFIPERGLTEEAVRLVASGRSVYDVQDDQWRQSRGAKPRKFRGEGRGAKIDPEAWYKHSEIGQVVQSISQLYGDRGYAFANVIPQPIPDRETGTLDVRLLIQAGDPQRIGKINISGNDPTLDKVVRREILVNEGEVYRGSLLDASRARLLRLGFFENVEISTPKGEGENVLDVNVKVTEQPTGSFSLGVGFGTVEGFAINASVQKNNFFGLGYNVNATVNWSQRQRNINLSFQDPYFFDSRWTFTLSGFWFERQIQLPEYQRGASVAIGRYLDRADDVQMALTYTIQDVGLSQLDASRRRLFGGQLFANGLTSTLGVSVIADKRNNRISPTKGVYATAELSLSGGFRNGEQIISLLGGDFNFVELNANIRFYQPLIPRSDWLVFRVNSTLGMMWSTDGNVIPFVHRYGAGGIQSVRGFPWFSLGPTIRTTQTDDPSRGDVNLVVRGTQFWQNNFELESPIVRAAGIKLVVFFDAGNAFGDPYGVGGINPLELRTSVGFGVRWQSPIGPLRFEWGFPLAPREDERSNLFDFSIGSFF